MKKLVFIGLFTIFLALFITKSFILLDPDFGWHIQMGQLILKSGIPATDPFSYTMTRFPFIDHEWLTNIAMYQLYLHGGVVLLSIVFSMLATLSLFIPIRFQITRISFLVLLLAFSTIFSFAGIRTQVITMVFTALFLWILLLEQKKKIYIWFLPLLMLLWVNMHGGFAVGVGIVFIFVAANIISRKKFDLQEISILLATLLATVVNPYGVRIWQEVFSQVSDVGLRFAIAEWLPAFFYGNIAFWAFFIISLVFVVTYWRKISTGQLVLYGALLAMAISSIRHIPLWILVALPTTISAFSYFEKDTQNVTNASQRMRKAFIGMGGIALVLSITSVLFSFFLARDSSENVFYPKKAAEYISTHPMNGNLFSYYSWAGYLLWKIPNKKEFVDGRMPSWRAQSALKGQSSNAFEDYFKITVTKEPFGHYVATYDIDTVILPTTDFVIFKRKLAQEGWKVIYQDQVSVVYRQKIEK